MIAFFDKKKTKILLIIVLILLAQNVYLNFILSKYRKREDILSQTINYNTDSIAKLKNIQKELYFLQKDFNRLVEVNNSLKNKLLNNDISDKIICIISKSSCKLCGIQILQNLSVTSDIVGKKNIIVLTDFNSSDELPDEYKLFDYYFVYNDTIIINRFNTGEPFIFLANCNLDIEYFFIPNLNPEFTNEYFYELLPSVLSK